MYLEKKYYQFFDYKAKRTIENKPQQNQKFDIYSQKSS